MEELIHIDNLCSRCGFFTSDTSVNGGYGCNHKDCDDGEYIYNGDIIDWHKAYRIVAIRLTKRNIDMETQTIQIKGDNDAIAYINFVDRDLDVSIVYGDNQYDFTIEPITLKALAYAYKLHCEEWDEKYNKV